MYFYATAQHIIVSSYLCYGASVQMDVHVHVQVLLCHFTRQYAVFTPEKGRSGIPTNEQKHGKIRLI